MHYNAADNKQTLIAEKREQEKRACSRTCKICTIVVVSLMVCIGVVVVLFVTGVLPTNDKPKPGIVVKRSIHVGYHDFLLLKEIDNVLHHRSSRSFRISEL